MSTAAALVLERYASCIEGTCGHEYPVCMVSDDDEAMCGEPANGWGAVRLASDIEGVTFPLPACSTHLWRLFSPVRGLRTP